MKSDVKALLRIFLWSGVVTVLVFAILIAAAADLLKVQTAAIIALGLIVVGGIVIGRAYGPHLLGRPSRKDESDSN
jgi:hypothetical protein